MELPPAGAGADDSHQLQLVQLELINNLSNLFQNLEAKHSETRQLLDLLSRYICHKFGIESDFPEEILKMQGFPIPAPPKRSQDHVNPAPIPAPANPRSSRCSVRLERLQDTIAPATAAPTSDPLDLEHLNEKAELEIPIPSKQEIEIPEEPQQLDVSNFLEQEHLDPLFQPIQEEEEMETADPLYDDAYNPPAPAPKIRTFKIVHRRSKSKSKKSQLHPCPRPNCHNSYATRDSLKAHMRENHGPVKRWLCPYDSDPTRKPCSYSSPRRWNLEQHFKREHCKGQGEEPELPKFIFVIEPEVPPELLETTTGDSGGVPQVQEIQLQLIES